MVINNQNIFRVDWSAQLRHFSHLKINLITAARSTYAAANIHVRKTTYLYIIYLDDSVLQVRLEVPPVRGGHFPPRRKSIQSAYARAVKLRLSGVYNDSLAAGLKRASYFVDHVRLLFILLTKVDGNRAGARHMGGRKLANGKHAEPRNKNATKASLYEKTFTTNYITVYVSVAERISGARGGRERIVGPFFVRVKSVLGTHKLTEMF